MRRRLSYDLYDVTRVPNAFLDGSGNQPWAETPLTLRNDALWEKFEKARRIVDDLRAQIIKEAVYEPLDALENELGREQLRMICSDEGFDAGKWDEMEARLLQNAIEADPNPIEGKSEEPVILSAVEQMVIADALDEVADLWEERAESYKHSQVAETRREMATDARRLHALFANADEVIVRPYQKPVEEIP